MTDIELLIDFHKNAKRLGPGGEIETKKALDFTGLAKVENLKIADIGCGTGAQTVTLAQNINGHISAVDLFPEFLNKLNEKAQSLNLQDKITTSAQSMDILNFKANTFDLIWSEGAIYIMGFEKGIKDWRRFLKSDGILAVSEITWFSDSRPKELEEYWKEECPEIDTAANKIKQMEKSGYSPMAYFKLPEYCWIKNYYHPIEDRLTDFLINHNHSKGATNLVESEKKEIHLYKKYKAYYGYGFYIAQKK